MNTIFFLIGFPLVVAIVLLVLKGDGARDMVVKIAAGVIAAASVFMVVRNFSNGSDKFHIPGGETIGYVMMGIEVILALVIIALGIKYKRYLAPIFAAVQTPILIWFELKKGHGINVASHMYYDRFSMIMILIIGVIGSLICVYAIGYMKDYQKHHGAGGDKRPWFFFLLFLFLSAMFGIVTSNNLIWMYFFWEITSLCSFFLIGYGGLFHKKATEDGIATRNAFRALVMNLAGGLSFVIGIIVLGTNFNTLEISEMLNLKEMGHASVMIPAIFFGFAGITKAAMMPFNSWLLGAMVAPTPTSALLHSSTMVKAGVFIIIKLSPLYGFNVAGVMITAVGGITFLMASFAAISQSNAKKVLAYSTVANLGLIVACGGIGTAQAMWAGIMLIVFHAVTKSLLFLCVGTAEHNIGSRDIEDMDGLFSRMPKLAAFMMVGIAGMFLAPFGMLISKWATMVTFVDTKNVLLILVICFGSAATAFYWTKWMGKLSAIMSGRSNIQANVNSSENFVQWTLVSITLVICLGFPIISSGMIIPHLKGSFERVQVSALSSNNMVIMCIMVAVLIMLFAFFFGKSNKKIVPIYMAGVNKGDNLTFENSMHGETSVSLRNWYMDNYFGEYKMNVIGVVATAVTIVTCMGMIVGGLIGGM